jgi:methyltransferase
MIAAYVILAVVALQRLSELPLAAHNTKRLLAQGGVEIGHKHYPLFIVLHAGWLVAIFLALPRNPTIHWLPLAGYFLLGIMRAWVIVTLGPYWTTRIITLPDAPLIRNGPYRFMRHPNYCIVIGEVALLPLVFGEIGVAIVFSVLNAALLFWRIRIENSALAPRREMPAPTGH